MGANPRVIWERSVAGSLERGACGTRATGTLLGLTAWAARVFRLR